jgi:pyrimidine operon attenuation protein/uracil phosphoribosyltransferase
MTFNKYLKVFQSALMCYIPELLRKKYIPLPTPISDEDVILVDDVTLRGS